jgi:hypothetical protein
MLLGHVWQPDADYNGCFALFKIKKSAQNAIIICSRLSHLTLVISIGTDKNKQLTLKGQ